MISLISKAAEEFDSGNEILMLDHEVLLRWVNVLERREDETHAQKKEEAYQEILCSHSIVTSAA